MACDTCTQTKTLTRCHTIIDLGTHNTGTEGLTIDVYFENLGTGKVRTARVITGELGQMDITHGLAFLSGQTYRVWLNQQSETMSEKEEWTLPDGTTDVTCVLIPFQNVTDNFGVNVTETTVQLMAV